MKYLIVAVFVIAMSACTSPSNIQQANSKPAQVEHAYVIVGSFGSEKVIALDSNQGHIKVKASKKSAQLHLIPVRVGETFSIQKVYMQPTNGDEYRYADISKPHVIQISRSGLYYFGAIYSDFGTVRFSKQVDRKLLARAKRQFPKTFKRKQPVNF